MEKRGELAFDGHFSNYLWSPALQAITDRSDSGVKTNQNFQFSCFALTVNHWCCCFETEMLMFQYKLNVRKLCSDFKL